MKILAIETSCDDTCITILEAKKSRGKSVFKILTNIVQSQNIHKDYGGVFPMMAKREHVKNIGPIFKLAMKEARNPKIDAIAVTVGPGLEPALWVGITFAKELAEKLKVLLVPVNHMEGHIFSIFPNKSKKFVIDANKKIFPVLSLLISGGHTELILMKDWMKYKKIGQTRDDAAGEAFDKVARMLGLPYPGGPVISSLAQSERRHIGSGSLAQTDGPSRENFQKKIIRTDGSNMPSELSKVILPRPMIYSKNYDFSFSGLKTAVLYMIRDLFKGKLDNKIKQKMAKEFEDALVEVLVAKTIRAVEEYEAKTLIVGGGVSANIHLQKTLAKALKNIVPKVTLHFPNRNLSTDNALMIAIAGYFQYQNKKLNKKSQKLKASGNLSL